VPLSGRSRLARHPLKYSNKNIRYLSFYIGAHTYGTVPTLRTDYGTLFRPSKNNLSLRLAFRHRVYLHTFLNCILFFGPGSKVHRERLCSRRFLRIHPIHHHCGHDAKDPRLACLAEPAQLQGSADPHVFGPPGTGSGSISQRHGSGSCSGSVSFYH
jgi:hypothetical protein